MMGSIEAGLAACGDFPPKPKPVDTGEPAYPAITQYVHGGGTGLEYWPGMSLRDRAALAALPEALAELRGRYNNGTTDLKIAVKAAWIVADLFLEARSASPVTDPASPKVGSDAT